MNLFKLKCDRCKEVPKNIHESILANGYHVCDKCLDWEIQQDLSTRGYYE